MIDNLVRIRHRLQVLLLLSAFVLLTSKSYGQINNENNPIEDDVHFDIKWPGAISMNFEKDFASLDALEMRTRRKDETYKCVIPSYSLDDELKNSLKTQQENSIETSKLFDPLYAKKLCSYRIESYWIYELCHGQYIKQYHETKQTGKKAVSIEYFLGYFNPLKQEPDYVKDSASDETTKPNVHWKTLDGKSVPMFAIKYTDGTKCEILSDKPRELTVFYACEENGNENIVGFEEISSCVYEMVVVTKLICDHPAYRLPEKSKHKINCFSTEKTVNHMPKNLVELENDRQSLMQKGKNKVKMTDREGETFIIHYKAMDADPDSAPMSNTGTVYIESESESSEEKTTPLFNQETPKHQYHQSTLSNDAEKDVMNSFLLGLQCLNGGVGWWKYEVCLGKHVYQYHEDDQTRKRTNILLGTWNKNEHLEWLKSNPNKRPLSKQVERTTITHYFANGDVCESTGKPRFVEVKLRCLKTKEKSYAVSLYLMEPITCEYILTIESPWLCDFVEHADMTGFNPTKSNEETDASSPKVNVP